MILSCPICGLTNRNDEFISKNRSSREYLCRCKTCGEFDVTHSFPVLSQNPKYEKKTYKISGLIREINLYKQETPFIQEEDLDLMLQDSRIPEQKDIREKSRKILRYLQMRSKFYGDRARIDFKYDYVISFCSSVREFCSLFELLEDDGMITTEPANNVAGGFGIGKWNYQSIEAKLTAKGWQLANELDNSRDISDQGFIAIYFDDSLLDSIKTIEEAITESGYSPMCIKEKFYPEKVMDKALGEIRRSKFVVADLTGNRSAVAFECGFAAALGLQIIYVCKNLDDAGFYPKNYQCLIYKTQEDLKKIIVNAIRARLPIK